MKTSDYIISKWQVIKLFSNEVLKKAKFASHLFYTLTRFIQEKKRWTNIKPASPKKENRQKYKVRYTPILSSYLLSKEDFNSWLLMSDISGKFDLTDKLFWLFSKQYENYVDAREIILCLELVENSNYSQTIKLAIDLSKEFGTIYLIREFDLNDVLSWCCYYDSDKPILRAEIAIICEDIPKDKDENMYEYNIKDLLINNDVLKDIIFRTRFKILNIESNIKEEIYSPLRYMVSMDLSHANKNKGIYFEELDRLLTVLNEREKIYEKTSRNPFAIKDPKALKKIGLLND